MYNNPFAPSAPAGDAAPRRAQAMTLFELNCIVRGVLHETLRQAVWVVAEVSDLRVASNGHCYLELVQKDGQSGSLVAKARATVWRSRYLALSQRFSSHTGQRLQSGLKVMALASVVFHELYGYSLDITDIDPSYTLGDIQAQRRAIIARLEAEGVIHLNRALRLPRLLRRVAVVSSETAAGYGDFCNQLAQSGFAFELKLFPAVMQGDRVEESIIAALDAIAAEADSWDVVAIIRGGGATTDLHGFDTYLLAANVAQFPLPVLTGIGHERDETILDLVAHKRLKTPTAVAAFLVESRQAEAAVLQALAQRLHTAAQAELEARRRHLTAVGHRLQLAAQAELAERRRRLAAAAHRLQLAAGQYGYWQRSRLARLEARLQLALQHNFHNEHTRLERVPQRLASAVERRCLGERHRLSLWRRTLQLASPDRILQLGYTLTLSGGRVVRDPAGLAPGDKLETRFAGGTVHSVVE